MTRRRNGAMVADMILTLLLLLQWPLEHDLLAVEDAREDAAPLVRALDGPHARQAIRALGRFERPELAASILPFLASQEPDLRIEALTALAQVKADTPLAPLLESEQDSRVRTVLYEAIGRLPEASEDILLTGLREGEDAVRLGAMKGLASFYRQRGTKPSEPALAMIRKTVRESRSPGARQLGLLTLNGAADRDRKTLESAFADPSPLVRRLAIVGLKEWRSDSSPLVRYEALRVHGGCARAEASLYDPNEHVVLIAIDLLGDGCSPAPLERILEENRGWRRPSRALVSLARISPERARKELPRFGTHPAWQARTYAARAAKILGGTESLAKLRMDEHPNVVAEALVTPEEALAALARDDYGLLVTALELLKGRENGAAAAPTLLETLARVSRRKERTSRDPRRLILERLKELEGVAMSGKLDFLLEDFDPAIAALAAEILTEETGRKVEAKTKHFAPDPLPSRDFLLGLRGASATIEMREAGSFTIELLPEAAPLTAAQFVQLAESGYYQGLTFHRIVPNFVIQGGSPAPTSTWALPATSATKCRLYPTNGALSGFRPAAATPATARSS